MCSSVYAYTTVEQVCGKKRGVVDMKVVAGESAPDLNSCFESVLFVPHNKI